MTDTRLQRLESLQCRLDAGVTTVLAEADRLVQKIEILGMAGRDSSTSVEDYSMIVVLVEAGRAYERQRRSRAEHAEDLAKRLRERNDAIIAENIAQ